ncbi:MULTISPECIES: hypothetical protein [Pseudomonas]|uniref:hypothetical protein n=1 Tax=Pseudomonas TaxID=286 RepID=UPI001F392EAA|nr:hypothetical protein [Pseudomonas faucium]
MKKLVPDPPHHFDLPDGTTLTYAIGNNLVPLDHVVVNITHYLTIAYTHSHRAIDGIADEAARESLLNGLRAMQLAWGQADALCLALERTGSLH